VVNFDEIEVVLKLSG